MRRADDRVELVERPHPASRDVVRVLDHEHGGLLVDHVLRAPGGRGDLSRRDPAGDPGKPDREQARVNRRPAELVGEDVGVLVRDEHVARAAVQLQRDLVRHRRRRQEQRPLLPEQSGGPLLQLVDRGVLAHLLVTDLRRSDRGAHRCGRAGDGVGAKIDHGCPFCTRRRCAAEARLPSVDGPGPPRDASRRIRPARVPRPAGLGVGGARRDGVRRDEQRAGRAARWPDAPTFRSRRSPSPRSSRRRTARSRRSSAPTTAIPWRRC